MPVTDMGKNKVISGVSYSKLSTSTFNLLPKSLSGFNLVFLFRVYFGQ